MGSLALLMLGLTVGLLGDSACADDDDAEGGKEEEDQPHPFSIQVRC